MIHILLHVLGVDDPTGRWYAFWSGAAGSLGMLATPVVLLRKHNCHAKGCFRIGRHPVENTQYVLCARHHPDDHKTAEEIQHLWRTRKESKHG